MKKKFYIYMRHKRLHILVMILYLKPQSLHQKNEYWIVDMSLQSCKFGIVLEKGETYFYVRNINKDNCLYKKIGEIEVDQETADEKVIVVLPEAREYEIESIKGGKYLEYELFLEVTIEIDDTQKGCPIIIDYTDELQIVSKSPEFAGILNQRLKQLPYSFNNYVR